MLAILVEKMTIPNVFDCLQVKDSFEEICIVEAETDLATRLSTLKFQSLIPKTNHS